MKIRIAVAIAVGVVLLGLLPYSLVKPPADGVFAILSGSINISDLLICAGLSFAAGFLASALCSPYGMQIGILAAPAGMAFWSIKSAALSTIFQTAPGAANRLAVYSALKLEGFAWLAIAGFCFLGAMAADKLFGKKDLTLPDKFNAHFKLPAFAAILIAVIAAVAIGNLLINALAADISYPDQKFGHVTGQPANLQIAFAVIVAFMACGFFTKLFLGTGFIWSAIAAPIITFYSISIYTKTPAVEYLVNTWPAVFFEKTAVSVLPVQMVAFSCIGAVWGYWLAVSYDYWRKHES